MRILFLLAFMFLPLAGAAAPADNAVELDQVIRALEAPFRAGGNPSAIRNFRAGFSQQSRLVSLDREQGGQGRVWVKLDRTGSAEPSRTLFRWEYEQPTSQVIVSNAETMWVYLPENNQVILSDLQAVSAEQVEDPMAFLTGLGNLSRDFTIGWAEPRIDKDGHYVLEMRPRKSSGMIERLVVGVDRDAVQELVRKGAVGTTFPLAFSTVYDPNGNATRVEFHDVQVNDDFSEDVFEFTVPEGVDVVRPGESMMGF